MSNKRNTEMTFAQFVEKAAFYCPRMTHVLCQGITAEEETELLESLASPLISPVRKDMLELLRHTNGMTDYLFLGYRLFDHENIIDSTISSGDVYEDFIILFEDGCGGSILYREDEVVLFDRDKTMIYRFQNLSELYQFGLEALQSGLCSFQYDEKYDTYACEWNETMIEKPKERLFLDWIIKTTIINRKTEAFY